MKANVLDMKSDKLFPFQFHIFGIAIAFMGLICLVFAPYVAPLLLLLALLIFTAHRGIEFDQEAKSYRIYNRFFFWKKGEVYNYRGVEKLYIHQARTSQKVYTMYTTGITSRGVVYDAYLKTADGDRIYLINHKDKNKLIERLQPLARFFNLQVSQ